MTQHPSSTATRPDTDTPPDTDTLPDDPRNVFDRCVALAGASIEAIPVADHPTITPCGMAVGELLEHLVMVLRRMTCAGRGEDPWQWPVDAADVAPDQYAAAWAAAADEAEATWADDALLDRPTDLPWGTFPGREALAVYIDEITVHTWDLAQATGQQPAWDDEVLAVADVAIHRQLPMADRTEMWAEVAKSLPPGIEWDDPFANAVEVSPDAPAIDRLVAWNGRTP